MRITLKKGAYAPEVIPNTEGYFLKTPKDVRISPRGGTAWIRTGVRFELQPNTVGILTSMCGENVIMSAPSDKFVFMGDTGAIELGLCNDGKELIEIKSGGIIAQFIILPLTMKEQKQMLKDISKTDARLKSIIYHLQEAKKLIWAYNDGKLRSKWGMLDFSFFLIRDAIYEAKRNYAEFKKLVKKNGFGSTGK